MTESSDIMADRATDRPDALGIVELADVCATMQARCADAFERLGRWATSDAATTADGRVRRALAAAAHRHAGHAESWARRAPTIPVAVAVPPVDATLDGVEGGSPDDVLAAYADWRVHLERDLDALLTRVDAELDPTAVDVVARVRFDLDRTAAELA